MTRRSKKKKKKLSAFPAHWADSLSSQAPCFVHSLSCQWRCVQKQNRSLAVLTIHSCWAETSATAPLISARLCQLCACKHLTRGFLSQSSPSCPSVTWVISGDLWRDPQGSRYMCIIRNNGIMPIWGQPESPCPAKMGNRKKIKKSLGGLKQAAKPQHWPWTAGTNLTPSVALSLTLPCRQLSNNDFMQEPPSTTDFPKLGWLCTDQQDSRAGRASCCHLFLLSWQIWGSALQGRFIAWSTMRGSHWWSKGNPRC